MPGYKASVEKIQENLRNGDGPKTSQAAQNVLRDVSSFGPNTPGLDLLKHKLEQLILKLEAEELKKEMEKEDLALKLEREKEEVALNLKEQLVPIPQREVPKNKGMANPAPEAVPPGYYATVASNLSYYQWLANECED